MNTIKEIEKLLTLSLSEASITLLCHLAERSLTQRRPRLTPDDLWFSPLMDVATDPARILVPASLSGYYTFPPAAFSCNLSNQTKDFYPASFPKCKLCCLFWFGSGDYIWNIDPSQLGLYSSIWGPEHQKAKDVIRSCVYKITASSRESRLWSKIRGDCEVFQPL